MTDKKRAKKGLLHGYDLPFVIRRIYVRHVVKSYNKMIPFNMPKAFVCYRLLGIKGGWLSFFEPPFLCDFGRNITVGKKFYANTGCTILDCAPVTIGDNVMLGPNVSIFTEGHPIHHEIRNTGLEYSRPVTIGDNVWVGGGSTILPGVTIGSNVVIGAGSLVNKDIPDNVIAVGNPCKPIRSITDDDKRYGFKRELIDNEGLERIRKRIK